MKLQDRIDPVAACWPPLFVDDPVLAEAVDLRVCGQAPPEAMEALGADPSPSIPVGGFFG